ncbi:hypothetical protein SG34_010465 [Thalassomonas viridans]|uniref:Uncharacterized protein n=1 Tax=Thalassomonas viridans TaxID=137584 RepID=A0AAE9Z6Z7_9GAMM|nr:hypothetical protein [Thalassomonas viridans]WDE07269.1 hypothetical protein SG34_010465 [Thalassomonas viridans]
MFEENRKYYWPTSMIDAVQKTKEHGLVNNQMSVGRIADQMGVSKETLYKWLATAKVPANKIISFEHSCGINYVTQYLAHSQDLLLISAPTGDKPLNTDIADLQIFMTEVAKHLLLCSQGKSELQEVINKIRTLMQDLAFHESNISQMEKQQSELSVVNSNG